MDATTNQVGEITKSQDGEIAEAKSGEITKAKSGEITEAKSGEITKAKSGTNRGAYDMFADYVVGDIIHHPSYGSGTIVGGIKGMRNCLFTPVTPSSPQTGSYSIGEQGKFAHVYVELDKIDPSFLPLPNPARPDTLRLVCNVDKAVVDSPGWHTNLAKSDRPGDITKA